jgi:hypothetical protein
VLICDLFSGTREMKIGKAGFGVLSSATRAFSDSSHVTVQWDLDFLEISCLGSGSPFIGDLDGRLGFALPSLHVRHC